MTTNTNTAICPQCGGNPDMDEDGRYFTCFFCCDTGFVSQEVVDEMEREEQLYKDHANSMAVRVQRCYFDEYEGCVAPHANLFTRLRGLEKKRPQYAAEAYDDIPF